MKLLLLLFLPLTIVQSENKELRWSANVPLTWDNYTALPVETSELDAWTYSGFRYEYNWSESEGGISWTLRAHSFFDPAQSWVKKNRKGPDLLAHEQLHFNIAELHCRYFKEKCANFNFTSNIEAELKGIYDEVFAALLQAQLDYDAESDHYKDKEGQAVWNEFVAEEMARLDKYKASIVSSAAKN